MREVMARHRGSETRVWTMSGRRELARTLDPEASRIRARGSAWYKTEERSKTENVRASPRT
jgi:hypothetical protein